MTTTLTLDAIGLQSANARGADDCNAWKMLLPEEWENVDFIVTSGFVAFYCPRNFYCQVVSIPTYRCNYVTVRQREG